jgi:L-malate glycosyltransferase
MKFFLISNMYPSRTNPSFGIFVKRITDGLKTNGATIVASALIKGRPNSILHYILAYSYFIFEGIIGSFKKFDVIFCHYALHSAPVALMASFISRKPLIVNIHGTDLLGKGVATTFLAPFRKILLRRANLIVVPSKYFKKRAVKLTGLKEEVFFVSPSGGVVIPIQHSCKRKREKLILGYVGRITKMKGVFLLLDVAKYLRKQVSESDFKIVLAGKGQDLKPFLSRVHAMGLSENIEYLGHFDQSELKVVYEGIDVLIFPTLLEESLGLVGLEAMSYGKPVIASKIGGITDYLIDGKNGFAFTPNDSDGICSNLQEMIDKPELIEYLSSNAFSTAKQYIDTAVSRKLCLKISDLLSEYHK